MKTRALLALKRLHQVRHVTALQERNRILEAVAVLQDQVDDTHGMIEALRHSRSQLWEARPIEMNRITLLKLTAADAQIRRQQLDAVATLNHLHEAIGIRRAEVVAVNSWVARVLRKQDNVAHVLTRLRKERVARQVSQEESDIQEQFYARQ